MDFINLLNSDVFELPKVQKESDPPFDIYLGRMLDSFSGAMKDLNGESSLVKSILGTRDSASELCLDIKKALSCYYRGFPNEAYNIISKAMEGRLDQFEGLVIRRSEQERTIPYLYRMRVGDRRVYDKKEIFHPPFEKRTEVAGYRYSIPGFPSLYLGGSTYVCWEEMKRPEFGRIHISRFRPVKGVNLKVLDFGYRPASLANLIEGKKMGFPEEEEVSEFLISQAALWPLLAACSVKTKKPESPFKPEYVIPQLLFEWIHRNSFCDGIRYFSNAVFSFQGVVHRVSNYVLPTKKQGDKGFCTDLKSKFEFTEPVSWEMLAKTQLKEEGSYSMGYDIEVANQVRTPYTYTEFATVEGRLNSLPCGPLE